MKAVGLRNKGSISGLGPGSIPVEAKEAAEKGLIQEENRENASLRG